MDKMKDAAVKAKEAAEIVAQSATQKVQETVEQQKQVRVGQKETCATCGKKTGLLIVAIKLNDGNKICSECLETMGLDEKQYKNDVFKNGFAILSLDFVQQALRGDEAKLEQIHNIRSTGSVAGSQTDGGKVCAICDEKIGLLSVSLKLKDGDVVCSECLEDIGVGEKLLLDDAFKKNIATLSSGDLLLAFEGDEREEVQARKKISDECARTFVATKEFEPFAGFDDTNKMWRAKHEKVARYDKNAYDYFSYSVIVDVDIHEDFAELGSAGSVATGLLSSASMFASEMFDNPMVGGTVSGIMSSVGVEKIIE